MDSHGRIFYIDHVHHTTTWNKPNSSSGSGMSSSSSGGGGGGRDSGVGSGAGSDEGSGERPSRNRRQHTMDRQRLDQRYQRVHRAIKAVNSSSVSSEADLDGADTPSTVSVERQRELLLQVNANAPILMPIMEQVRNLELLTGSCRPLHMPSRLRGARPAERAPSGLPVQPLLREAHDL